MYRVQQFGPRLASMHWHMHHDGARHSVVAMRIAREDAAGHRIGAIRFAYAATAPLPPGVEETSSPLLTRRHRARAVQTIEMPVPANSEIVIEATSSHATLLGGLLRPHGLYSSRLYPASTSRHHDAQERDLPQTIGQPHGAYFMAGDGAVFRPCEIHPRHRATPLPISGVFPTARS